MKKFIIALLFGVFCPLSIALAACHTVPSKGTTGLLQLRAGEKQCIKVPLKTTSGYEKMFETQCTLTNYNDAPIKYSTNESYTSMGKNTQLPTTVQRSKGKASIFIGGKVSDAHQSDYFTFYIENLSKDQNQMVTCSHMGAP